MCNRCSETEKRDRSDLGIPECKSKGHWESALGTDGEHWIEDSEWIENEQHYGSIFSMRDLRSMEVCADLIGRASANELFGPKAIRL